MNYNMKNYMSESVILHVGKMSGVNRTAYFDINAIFEKCVPIPKRMIHSQIGERCWKFI